MPLVPIVRIRPLALDLLVLPVVIIVPIVQNMSVAVVGDVLFGVPIVSIVPIRALALFLVVLCPL